MHLVMKLNNRIVLNSLAYCSKLILRWTLIYSVFCHSVPSECIC